MGLVVELICDVIFGAIFAKLAEDRRWFAIGLLIGLPLLLLAVAIWLIAGV